MADRPVIKAELRTEFGKGFARRLRRDWKVPGVVYGSGQEPIHFAVPLLDIQSLVRNNGVNAVLELEIDGEQHLTMVKHVDQNVLTLDIDHVDLLAIKRGEKVEVEVPVTIEGEPAPGMMYIQDADVLMVEADVLNIPEELVVSIEGLEDGAVVTAADITLPEGTTLVAEEDTVIASISEPEVDEDLEAAAESAEEGGADAGAESVDDEGESSEDNDDEE
ncbi:MAG: 50S ribosomal protein L25/general stress protein Ctc [Corynebacterium camporealensis]|uniref:50S ribosomal protein L25/general stress protein Ctc n=1 Tax=Corynebacterium camporealensis TaxID=161896 RepID=UPI002A918CB7|nr:50S ribosomal protein L25/general stress protein Ctc [Corynebacterium camporealensis]MDY5840662.1 50S ribosomal protein L25/general stress protein Ctc [Corynebacterium camporealensis]